MDPSKIAERLAEGGRVRELRSAPNRGVGSDRMFRVSGEPGRIIKVYGSSSHERRETHALQALAGIEGLPVILDRGSEDDSAWVIFLDAGQWSLTSLPENPALARRAGEILRSVHTADTAKFSNLARGIDQDWVSIDFGSTFRRIERYRGRLRISKELLGAARDVSPPSATEPRVAHTNTIPENFLVDNEGNVTLVNWEWATLAPPEWDLSRTRWLLGLRLGSNAAEAFKEGYGSEMDAGQLDRWIVYHAGMMLVYEAEKRPGGRLDDLSDLVAELQRAVATSTAAE